jgi:hypothetical protein
MGTASERIDSSPWQTRFEPPDDDSRRGVETRLPSGARRGRNKAAREPMKSTDEINPPLGWEIRPVKFGVDPTHGDYAEALPMDLADKADAWGLYEFDGDDDDALPYHHSDHPTAKGALEEAALQKYGEWAESLMNRAGEITLNYEAYSLASRGKAGIGLSAARHSIRSPLPYGPDRLRVSQPLKREEKPLRRKGGVSLLWSRLESMGIPVCERGAPSARERAFPTVAQWLLSPLNTTPGRWIVLHSAAARNSELVGWLSEVSGHRFPSGTVVNCSPLIGGGNAALWVGGEPLVETRCDTVNGGRFDRIVSGLAESLLAL